VIDNIVWTNSWLSIVGVCSDLTGVGAGEEQVRKVIACEASRCERTSRLRLSDSVASGVKCGTHGGKNGKMKSGTASWLSLKTKLEPGLHGSQVMSGD
jgi:hypothetical protein